MIKCYTNDWLGTLCILVISWLGCVLKQQLMLSIFPDGQKHIIILFILTYTINQDIVSWLSAWYKNEAFTFDKVNCHIIRSAWCHMNGLGEGWASQGSPKIHPITNWVYQPQILIPNAWLKEGSQLRNVGPIVMSLFKFIFTYVQAPTIINHLL